MSPNERNRPRRQRPFRKKYIRSLSPVAGRCRSRGERSFRAFRVFRAFRTAGRGRNGKYRGSSRTCAALGHSTGRVGEGREHDIKLLEITSAYYFNFVDCLTAVTPGCRGNSRESFLRIISPRYRSAAQPPAPSCRISLTVSEGICWPPPPPLPFPSLPTPPLPQPGVLRFRPKLI